MVLVLCDSDARKGGTNLSAITFSKRRRHTPDQIICKFAEGHKQLAASEELEPESARLKKLFG